MALIVEEAVAFGPIHIGFFCSVGIMLEAEGVPYLIEEFFWHERLTFLMISL